MNIEKSYIRIKHAHNHMKISGKFPWVQKSIKSVLYLTLLSFIFYLVISPLGFPVNASDKTNQIVLQLAWKHQFQFAGYYAALSKGYYKEAGLDVVLVEGGEGHFAREEVLGGHAQYGVAGSELILHKAEGNPFVVLAPIFQHSPSILLILANSGISTYSDLIGKRVMLLPGKKDADILAAFQNEGIDIDHDSFIRMDQSYNLDDLINGRTDSVSAYVTNEPWILEQEGIKPGILSPLTYGVDFYSDCLFTTEEEITKHPERVSLFLKATLKGWAYAMDNKEEIIDLIIDQYGVHKAKDHLRYEAATMEKLIFPHLVEIGHMNPGRWRHIADTYGKLGMLETDFSLDGFLYDPNPVPDHSRLIGVIFLLFMISLVTSIITIVLSIFNKKLKKESHDRKLAVKALQESEAKFKEFMLHLPAYAFIKDRSGEYLYVNKAFGSITKSSPLDRLGKTDNDIFQSDIAKQLRANDAEVFRTGKSIEKNETITDADGNYRTNLVIKFPIIRDGVPLLLGGIALDVTERVKMEKMLVQSEKMLSVGGLAAGMAHELNNPLGGMIQNAQVIYNRFTKDLPANRKAANELDISLSSITDYMEKREILKLLSSISEAGDRAAHIVENMLSFSQQPGHHSSHYNLGDLLDKTIELAENDYNLKQKYDFKKIKIIREYEPSIPEVQCEGSTIQQVFFNILRNGAEAMAESNTQMEETQKVEFSYPKNKFILRIKAENGLACIEIEDNGPGMKENIRKRIFDPFFTTKPTGIGTGLGLSVSYFIITENHGGEINVRSEPGKGTTFIICLPFEKSMETQ
ncbi:MAG: ABC transporter substrate-binding protein [Desulfobacterium sp.]|nr:ABC transporter substrate-binding protein [Desulfobacterium sp.]